MRNKKWSADEMSALQNMFGGRDVHTQIVWRTSRPHSNLTCPKDSFSSYRLPRRVLWRLRLRC